ncbi:recombinase activating protein, putative [Babesia ovata]|uniref:Recombinase activating protein, putative n=1 Tax=Babesia ovata TaxID=189622 RepID=A0A2H6KHC2_9APIC|nr:recombinase activating protein, putative [Babesia ovata]GBE62390.1 recombinase activating protein, putative [Babesia ovata]
MSSMQVSSNDSKEYTVFPSADSIRKSGFLDGDVGGDDVGVMMLSEKASRTYAMRCTPVNTDEFDSFIEDSMNHLDHINASRGELRTKMFGSTILSNSGRRSWEDAVVDCRIELFDQPSGNHAGKPTDNLYGNSEEKSFHHALTRQDILYDTALDDDDLIYLPSSNGLHSSYLSSHPEDGDIDNTISPTRCFSRLPKRARIQPNTHQRATEYWRSQPVSPLTDKAIASVFAKSSHVETGDRGFDNYYAYFHDEDFSKFTKEPNMITILPRGDWTPRDIKMCGPFKACRGEASKISKSGGPIYGDGLNHEPDKSLDSAVSPLEGLFMVTADIDSDEDVESYEHLYKAELDLLVERGEQVDLQEMDEWHYQAGLTAPQVKNHQMAFRRLLRLHCNYFGKRVYPYRGELDSLASKSLHVLDPDTNTFEVSPAMTRPEKLDLRKVKKRPFMDRESAIDTPTNDATPGTSGTTTIPLSTYRLFDYETEPRFIRNPTLKVGASNVRHLYDEETSHSFIKSPSFGLRHAISDFQTVTATCEKDFQVPLTLKQLFPTKDKYINSDVTLMNQRNFILKVLLRFPYLDLKQLGLTSF